MLGKAEYTSFVRVQQLLSTPSNTSQCSARAAIIERFFFFFTATHSHVLGGELTLQSKLETDLASQTEHLDTPAYTCVPQLAGL